MLMKSLFLLGTLFASVACAQQLQPLMKVSSVAWQGLSAEEKAFIQKSHMIETLGAESFGVIIDIQGVDRSKPGTSGGSSLGGAIANAAYVDKAFSGNNDYSAKTHLAAMLLGGFLGSSLDKKPQSQYQFRYAIRLGNGSITYHDQTSQDPFRHPVGVCIFLPSMTLLTEQHICTQTTESLRQAYISVGRKPLGVVAPAHTDSPSAERLATQENQETLINCKANNLAVVRTTTLKCNAIQGVIIQ